MSRTSKKTIAISNNLYQRNKNDPTTITNTLESTRSEFSLIAQNLQSQINDLYGKVDYVKKMAGAQLSISPVIPTETAPYFNSTASIENKEPIPPINTIFLQPQQSFDTIPPASPQTNPFVESPLSTKYIIETNTLTIEHTSETNTFFFPLGINSINRLVINNIPMNTNSLYKYTFYIKREPYKAGAAYINIENIVTKTPSGDTNTVELSITGADVKKPSVNATFIKQEFYIFCYCYRLSGFQTLVEF